MFVMHLTLYSFPDAAPCKFVSQSRGLGECLVTITAIGNQSLHLLLETGILLTQDEVLRGLTHVGIEVTHLLDDCHRSILLDLIPKCLMAFVVYLRTDEVFGIHQSRSSCNSGRLLYHNRQRSEYRTLLEQSHHLVNEVSSRISSSTAVQV